MNEHYKFVNLPLPYPYDGLEPYIDTKTMELHHDRHAQTYVDNLNNILKDYPQLQNLTLKQLITNVVSFPQEIQVPILNNAGGVYNHQFYFAGMTDKRGDGPKGALESYLNMVFGSYEKFQQKFQTEALSVFGSGYAWLVVDQFGMLRTLTTPNQGTPDFQRYCPVICLDIWEHAYYLKHYNMRADYVKDWFQVVNWDMANRNFMTGLSGECFYGLELSTVYNPM